MLVSLIALLRELLVSTIFRVVHAYIVIIHPLELNLVSTTLHMQVYTSLWDAVQAAGDE